MILSFTKIKRINTTFYLDFFHGQNCKTGLIYRVEGNKVNFKVEIWFFRTQFLSKKQ